MKIPDSVGMIRIFRHRNNQEAIWIEVPNGCEINEAEDPAGHSERYVEIRFEGLLIGAGYIYQHEMEFIKNDTILTISGLVK